MSKSNKMGVVQLTILTMVNMMGSGIIMLPTKLAEVGTISIISAGNRGRLHGAGMGICQMRNVQPQVRRDGRLRRIRLRQIWQLYG